MPQISGSVLAVLAGNLSAAAENRRLKTCIELPQKK